jgi:hypothetical protein
MSFNTTTGALTGTPTTVQSFNFIVTGINASGSVTRTFSLTVSPPLSTDATLSIASKIKGQTLLSLGTPNPVSPANGGTVTLSSVQAADTSNSGNYITSFITTNANAAITGMGKVQSGQSVGVPYNGTAAIANGDLLFIGVTAQDGTTSLNYLVTVTVTPPPVVPLSTDATLSTASKIKGQTLLSLGTPGAQTWGANYGAVTISATQAASTSNAANWITTFITTNANATVKSVVRQSPGGAFGDEYNGSAAITNGDIFFVEVWAQLQSYKLFYVIQVTVTPPLAIPAFTLSSSSEVRTANTAATGFTITSTGGTIASFAIDATPAGMSFNTTTGALTGTPTTVAGATNYNVIATNASGSVSKTFSLTVLAALSADATLSTATKIKGQSVLSLGTPNPATPANGGTVTISAIQAADTTNTGSYITSFVTSNSSAAVTMVAKQQSGQAYFEPYNGPGAINNGDNLIIEVTAQDGVTKLLYMIQVTVS